MVLAHLVKDTCPRCHGGKVFRNTNLLSFRSGEMNDKCPVCNLDFKKEPGFYWGAMFVSYGLALVEAIIAYWICRLAGNEAFSYINLWVIIAVILVFSPFNFRMARLVWLYILPGF